MTGGRAAWRSTEAGRAILDAAEELVADADSGDGLDPLGAPGRIVAIAWATVDLDRAERELGGALGVPLVARPAAREPALGARTRVARPFRAEPALLLLEPDTEGRLAAILARRGEGVAAVVLESADGSRGLVVTSDRGGRRPRASGGRRPSTAG